MTVPPRILRPSEARCGAPTAGPPSCFGSGRRWARRLRELLVVAAVLARGWVGHTVKLVALVSRVVWPSLSVARTATCHCPRGEVSASVRETVTR